MDAEYSQKLDSDDQKKRKHHSDELEIDTVDSERLRRKKQKKERKARQADEAAALVHNAVPKGAIAAAITPPHVTACAVGDVRRGKATEAECIESERSDSPTVSHRKQKKSKAPKPALINPDPGSATVQEASPSAVEAFLAEHSINIISDTPITPIISFGQLAIPPDLSASLQNFKSPTAIQACTWPPALQGRDVVGIAETGSGKTLAFGIPALSHILSLPSRHSSSSKSVLVLSPTRELAMQTHATLVSLATPFSITSVCVFGGVPKDPQIKMLKNTDQGGLKVRIVVGTPGRVLDLINEGVCDLSQITYLVLDEADRMLDKGFENDIRAIISHTKQGKDRQTMMFSATWPEAVRRLASTFQRNTVRVTIGSDDLTANSKVEQILEVFDDVHSKDNRLLKRLGALTRAGKDKTACGPRILIFALYKKEASRVESMLRRQGYAVGALHGDMSQNNRIAALDAFRSGTTGLLVATDVAARGLDIPNVEAVINYTFPLTVEDYIHRIGRTARGGRTGKSITFFTGENHERALAGELARLLRDGGFGKEADALKKFPMAIKKREHSVYGAFFRDDIPAPKVPKKIVF